MVASKDFSSGYKGCNVGKCGLDPLEGHDGSCSLDGEGNQGTWSGILDHGDPHGRCRRFLFNIIV